MARENLVYFLTGKEEFLKEEEIRRIKSKLLNEKEAIFNYSVFYGKEADARTILEAAKSLPFLSSYRLIVVRDVDRLNHSDKELLLSYIHNPNEHTVLVLETSQEDGEGFSNLVSQRGKIFHFKRLRDDEILHWAHKKINSNGKRIEAEALNTLVDNVGDDLRSLSHAIDSLISYVNRDLIVEKDVKAVVGISSVGSTFELADAIGQKDTQGALRILSSLLNSGQKPPQILGLIVWHWRRLCQAKELLSRGETKDKLIEKLGIKGYILDKFIRQLSNFHLDELKEGFSYLLEVDVNIKTGRLGPRLCLEALVVKLCQRRHQQ